MCVGANMYCMLFVEIISGYMAQELSGDQTDTVQPAVGTELSAAGLVSHFVSVKPNAQERYCSQCSMNIITLVSSCGYRTTAVITTQISFLEMLLSYISVVPTLCCDR